MSTAPPAEDEASFERLVAPFRGELHAHCYRMLGSVHDADDALQDALLRAWRGLPGFAGRSSMRTWLYRIATNTSLDLIQRRSKRTLPIDHGPAADPADGPGEPLVESVWIEPYPDERLGVEDGMAGPEARFERRESLELAFTVALQHLPARQRAVLILREVLGFSAEEVAATLETTVASVNSALQRARRSVDERLPERSQQATLRFLGDEKVRAIVEAYADAMERADIDAVVGMLAEDAAWSMPPAATWFGGRESIVAFLRTAPLSGRWRWRHVPVRCNGQVAVGCYTSAEGESGFTPFCIDVLTLDGPRIAEITAFIVRSSEDADREVLARWPDQAVDRRRLGSVFERFGLPLHLEER